MAESCKAKHVQIPSKKHKKEIFNIQLINYYHSSLKGMTNIRFRGVATKYLNNYIVYNNFVTFAKESFMEKIRILKDEIFTVEFSHARERCSHRCERLKNLVVH